MEKAIALLICFLILQTGWGQWTTVDTDNFDEFPTDFSSVGFGHQPGGAETGGASDFCAYRLNVGTSPTTLYLAKRYFLEADYIYRFSFYMKRLNQACGITFKHASSAGTGGIVISSEFTPPQRADNEAGDIFVSSEITGTNTNRYLKAIATTGSSGNNRLRIDGFKLERMSVLPITLLSFTATSKEQSVFLNWQTASESNNDYMAIERSGESQTFIEISRIIGTGTTNEPTNYQFIDKNPITGENYYRLRQVDFDGHTEYHKIIAIHIEQKNEAIFMLHTIVTKQLDISFSKVKTNNANVHIFDSSGKRWQTDHLLRGETQHTFDIGAFPKGLYFAQLINGQEASIRKFIKQ